MSFQNNNSIQGTILQLKDIVTSLKGEEDESARLIRQMEELIKTIELKSRQPIKNQAFPITSSTVQAAGTHVPFAI